jgi:hypothetical protein
VPWIIARVSEVIAHLLCHLKGITLIPFVFKTAIVAVNINDRMVIEPVYRISGLPKILKNAI